MPEFSTQRSVRHTPEEMFALVADVERYPEFLPLCEDLVVRSRETSDGHPVIVADMAVGYKGIRETFTSRVMLDKPNRKIHVSYVDGPFRYLENVWTFREAPAGCTVDFFIRYEFKSPLLGMLMGGLFDRAFRKFAEAFEERARVVYGAPKEDATGDDWLSGSLRRARPHEAS